MREIPLTQDQVALVDDEDYERLSRYKWCAQRVPGGRYYAIRNTRQWEHGKHGKRRRVYMHQQITGRYARAGEPTADHINGNGLDNRRENLRIIPWGHNVSRARRTGSKTGYRGVGTFPNPEGLVRPFYAHLAGKSLGAFGDRTEAALAYDLAAIDHFGPCAVTNFLSYERSNDCTIRGRCSHK